LTADSWATQPLQGHANIPVRELQHGIAIATLIARSHESVQGEWIVLRRGLLLLEQATDHPDLSCIELAN